MTAEEVYKYKHAYESSIKERRCVKVKSGFYYYKGMQITKDFSGSADVWNWKGPDEELALPAPTKRAAINWIESYLKEHNIPYRRCNESYWRAICNS